jgi:lysozyme
MKLDAKGKKALHDREGLRLKPYLCTQGVPTIAMGNTYYLDGRKVTMKDIALTITQAIQLSDAITAKFEIAVSKALKVKVNQNQFNALVSITYNIGINGLKTSTFLKLVNKNPNDPKISDAIMLWIKNKELIGRRKSEVKQYFLA